MGHINNSYIKLQNRLDDQAQGAPESKVLYEILKILFTKKEAELVSLLPINFFTLERAAKLWKKSLDDSEKILNELADKGLLFDFKTGDTRAFIVAPSMAGFIEFALMRMDGRFDAKLLSELFKQYINDEEDFSKRIFLLDPPIDRIFIQEDTIQKKDKTEVLDYERATSVIKNSSFITVSQCYCRHRMHHRGYDCEYPRDVCLTFNKPAESLYNHKISKKINKTEAKKILEKSIDLGLVQLGDNIQNDVNWICNCCSCCCEGLGAYKRLGYQAKINSNYYSKAVKGKCVACGICVKKCPVDALQLIKGKKKNHIRFYYDRCIGCGVCVRFCNKKARVMEKREEKMFVPYDTFERYILNAITSVRLQNYIFDNYTLWTHDILRKFFKVLLNLKPVKFLMANRQLKSRFLIALTKTSKYELFDKLCNDGKKADYSHPEMKK